MTGVVVLRRVVMAALLTLIVLRPGLGETTVATTGTAAVSIVLVVDRTKSMDALDVDAGPRLDRLRTDLIELVRSLPRARFALISFATRARVDVPLTSDLAVVEMALAELALESPLRAGGSRLDRPLEAVEDLARGTIRQAPDGFVRIVLASDGENTDRGDQESYTRVGGLFSDGAVLGYGTEAGGLMTVAGGTDRSQGFIPQRSTGQPATSRLDSQNLRSVAAELGVPYVHRDRPEGIDAIATRVGVDVLKGTTVSSRELTWLYAMLLLLLTLVELRAALRGLLSTVRDRGRSR